MNLAFPGAAVAQLPGITSLGGAIRTDCGSPPFNFRLGKIQSEDICLFAEKKNVQLSEDLTVDSTTAQELSGTSTEEPGTIASGQHVDSFLVHFDWLNTQQQQGGYREGKIIFEQPVLGVVVRNATLRDTQMQFGMGEWTYADMPSGLGEEVDQVALAADYQTLSMSLNSSSNFDQVRILVASAPATSMPSPAVVVEPTASSASTDPSGLAAAEAQLLSTSFTGGGGCSLAAQSSVPLWMLLGWVLVGLPTWWHRRRDAHRRRLNETPRCSS